MWLAIIKACTLIAMVLLPIGLMPDEAQYWTWSKRLSLGYYTKPPAIAWQIAAGCFLFGDTELGVRISNVILSFWLGIAVYLLALRATLSSKDAFLAAIAFSLCPLGIIAGFLSTVDCGFILFWTLACTCFLKDVSRFQEDTFSYRSCALMIACGALWKWAIYFLWLPLAIFCWSVGRISIKKLFSGIALSCVGLIAPLVWNMRHGWPTIHHLIATFDISQVPPLSGQANAFAFLGAQAALVSPLLFLLFLWATWSFAKNLSNKNVSLQFCWWVSTGLFCIVFFASFLRKIQGNWAVFVYPTGFVMMLAALASIEGNMKRKMIAISLGISSILLVFTFSIPMLQQIALGSSIPWKFNPWRQGLGLHVLEQGLLERGYISTHDFLFSDRYQEVSQISFYGPQKKLAYFLNIHDLRKNQFSYWPSMRDRCIGKTGFFVSFVEGDSLPQKIEAAKERFLTLLSPYFLEIHPLPPIELYSIYGKPIKAALIFKCLQYNGKMPRESTKY